MWLRCKKNWRFYWAVSTLTARAIQSPGRPLSRQAHCLSSNSSKHLSTRKIVKHQKGVKLTRIRKAEWDLASERWQAKWKFVRLQNSQCSFRASSSERYFLNHPNYPHLVLSTMMWLFESAKLFQPNTRGHHPSCILIYRKVRNFMWCLRQRKVYDHESIAFPVQSMNKLQCFFSTRLDLILIQCRWGRTKVPETRLRGNCANMMLHFFVWSIHKLSHLAACTGSSCSCGTQIWTLDVSIK